MNAVAQQNTSHMITNLDRTIQKMKAVPTLKEKAPFAHEISNKIEYMYQTLGEDDRGIYFTMATDAFVDAMKDKNYDEHGTQYWLEKLGSNIYEVHIHSNVAPDVMAACVGKSIDAALMDTKTAPDNLKHVFLKMTQRFLCNSIGYSSSPRTGVVGKEDCTPLLEKYYNGSQEVLATIPMEDQEARKNTQDVIAKLFTRRQFLPHMPEAILVKEGVLSLDKKGRDLQDSLADIEKFLENKDETTKQSYLKAIDKKINPLGGFSKLLHKVTKRLTREDHMLGDCYQRIQETIKPQ